MFSLFSLVFFYLLNKSLEYHNQIIYTCIFISKKLQNNPILIYIVRFLISPQGPASLCKPWNCLWTWMLGQHAGCSSTSSNYCPASTPSRRLGRNKSAKTTQLGLSSHALISTTQLYQQYTYINNALISTMHLYQQ